MSATCINDICGKCSQPNLRTCSDCNLRYCPSCINDHLSQCKSFQFTDFDDYKIILTAKRDLQAGDVILSEFPFAVGPKLPPKRGFVPCVGCCRLIPEAKVVYCSSCLWPVCSSTCPGQQNSITHGLECKILSLQKSVFSKTKVNNYRFDILLPLRVLFIQNSDKNHWNNFLTQIEKHFDKIKNDLKLDHDYLSFFEENILNPLKKFEGESGFRIFEEISKDLFLKISEYLKTQTFEMFDDSVQIFYGVSNLIQHSCLPNSFLTIDVRNQYKVAIRANSFISKNSPITLSYTNLFQGTYRRLLDLKALKNSVCCCSRCSDPTEFGTFFSSLKCLGTRKEPCGGNQLPVDPLNPETIWICDKCKIELPNDQMMKFMQHLGNEVEKILSRNSTIDDLEEFLAKLFMFLHPNHFYVCQIKYKLTKLYQSDDLLLTKIEICKNLLEIVKKFCPNGSLLLGDLLHELFEAKFRFLIINFSDRTKNSFNESVKEISGLLEECQQNLEAHFDYKFSKIIEADVDKFSEWFNKMSVA